VVLCEQMETDPQAARTSLVGLFHARQIRRFPSPRQVFTVYTTFFDGVGEGTMELVITRQETEREIYRYQRWQRLPGRGLPANVEIKVTKCVFPAPGRYALTLLLDGQEITTRFLDIFPAKGR
jgi:hypothetical protein